MALNIQVFTNIGITMLGQADAGATLNVTRIVAGSGTANQDSDLYPLTQLINWGADVTITRQQDLGNGVMLVSGVLNEWDMPAGPPFQLRELGIMAWTSVSGGTKKGPLPPAPSPPPSGTGPAPAPPVPQPVTTDQLYCVSNVYHDTPQTITPGGTNSWAFDIQVVIDRATSVVINVGQVSTYDCQNIPTDDLTDPGWYSGRQGNVFQFKRAVQGVGILLDKTTYPDRIIISAAQLQNNLDLYVPMNNPDYVAGPNKAIFPTIQAAHDYLLQFTIPPQYHANIHIHELNHAVISLSAGLNFTHPNSSQINIYGEAPVSYNMVTPNAITPGAGSDKVVHISGSTTGLAVGQFVAILDSFWGYGGGCYIKSIAGTAITCNTYDQGGMPIYGKTDNGNSHPRLVRLPTVIQLNFTPNQIYGMVNLPYGIGLIQNICFVGDPRNTAPSNNLMNYTTYIIDGGGNGGYFVNVWTFCGRRGFNLYNGAWNLACDHPWPYVGAIVAANCAFGILGTGPITAFDRTYVNGCTQGICPGGAGMAIGSITGGMDYTIVYLNHCYLGINCSGMFLGGTYVMSCNWIAVQAYSRGSITMGAAYPSLFEWNAGLTADTNNTDIVCYGSSYIWYDRRGQNNPPYNPRCNISTDSVATADLQAGQLSYIHLQNTT